MARSTLKFLRCLNLAAVFAVATAAAVPPGIRVLDDPTRIEVSSALPPAGIADEKFLTIALLDTSTGKPGAPIFGKYTHDDGRLVFRPSFALTPGARYRVTAGNEYVEHQVPAMAPKAGAVVTSILPTATEVPANLLKFYLHFSRPMREGREVFEHILLLDETGQPIAGPWRDTELWTEDARRLTLWIHPGRVKRGVNLREEIGPVLRPGARYTLVVKADLRDASGQPLAREFRHGFRTTPELHSRLDLAAWTIHPPFAGTRDPLRAHAPAPLDAVIAGRTLHVQDATGREVQGQGALAEDARSWIFTPRDPWPAAVHEVLADPRLEDLAGNTFERIFDQDLAVPPPAAPSHAKRAFTPR